MHTFLDCWEPQEPALSPEAFLSLCSAAAITFTLAAITIVAVGTREQAKQFPIDMLIRTNGLADEHGRAGSLEHASLDAEIGAPQTSAPVEANPTFAAAHAWCTPAQGLPWPHPCFCTASRPPCVFMLQATLLCFTSCLRSSSTEALLSPMY